MTLFEGLGLPREVKMMSKSLGNLDDSTFNKILQLVQDSLEEKVSEGALQKAFGDHLLDDPQRIAITTSIAGLLMIFKAALRLPSSKLKKEMLEESLEEFKIPSNIISRLCEAILSENCQKMNRCQLLQCPRLPTLKRFRWRIDVSIATNSLSRNFERTIMVRMVTSDDKVWNFEMPIKRFHQLRCNVAILLKEMDHLENRNTVKMIDS